MFIKLSVIFYSNPMGFHVYSRLVVVFLRCLQQLTPRYAVGSHDPTRLRYILL